MGQKLVGMKAAHGKATLINGDHYMAHVFPSSQQFITRSCIRCNGLLVTEWHYDLQNPNTHNAETFRCVQCGNRVDPIILENRTRVQVKPKCVKLIRPICAVQGGELSHVA